MRVIVTGSRHWEGPWAEEKVFDVLMMLRLFALSVGQELTIVHGACPTGADLITDIWCQRTGTKMERHPADWKRFGKGAGPRRNQEMLDLGADMVIGFHRDNSTGTGHMLAIARHARIFPIEVEWNPPIEEEK